MWYVVAVCACVAAAGAIGAQPTKEQAKVIVTANNPDPRNLPTLGVWQEQGMTYVSATFPNAPDFTCDSWCYESAVDFIGARALEGGRIELRHRVRDHPAVILVTTVTPERGAVEFLARAELENGAQGEVPSDLLAPNMCWQLKRARGFASAPDPYPEFVKRCFIFTKNGRAFLDHTTRKQIPCRAADDAYNNPPWVQMYLPEGMPTPEVGPTSWADYSPDRYTVPIIGAVSRDGKWLAALASDSAKLMCQAWHDCMHNSAEWAPAGGGGGSSSERHTRARARCAGAPPGLCHVWRLRVYVMANDAQALLKRAGGDFALKAESGSTDAR